MLKLILNIALLLTTIGLANPMVLADTKVLFDEVFLSENECAQEKKQWTPEEIYEIAYSEFVSDGGSLSRADRLDLDIQQRKCEIFIYFTIIINENRGPGPGSHLWYSISAKSGKISGKSYSP